MADEQREDVRRHVFGSLTRPDFRRRLTATTSDGERPIIVALREDPLSSVLSEIEAAGGAGNVAVPLANGLAVLAMTFSACRSRSGKGELRLVRTDCTVGVFCQRVLGDAAPGEAVEYGFRTPASATPTGRSLAELVAVSG